MPTSGYSPLPTSYHEECCVAISPYAAWPDSKPEHKCQGRWWRKMTHLDIHKWKQTKVREKKAEVKNTCLYQLYILKLRCKYLRVLMLKLLQLDLYCQCTGCHTWVITQEQCCVKNSRLFWNKSHFLKQMCCTSKHDHCSPHGVDQSSNLILLHSMIHAHN